MPACAHCQAENKAFAAICIACGRPLLARPRNGRRGSTDSAVDGNVVDAANEIELGGAPMNESQPKLLDESDLPGWLRSLEERSPGATVARPPSAPDDVASWIVEDQRTVGATRAPRMVDPADSWLHPAQVTATTHPAAEAVFAEASKARGGAQPLPIRETLAPDAPAPLSPAARPIPMRQRPQSPSVTNGRSIATVVLIIAILIFLASLAFFIMTISRG